MFKITIRNTSGRDICLPNDCSGTIVSAHSEWEFKMGEVTKRVIVECPEDDCAGRMSVPHVDSIKELVGCVIGCVGCGKHLICEPPGEFVVFDDKRHKATKDLPKGDDV